MKQLVILGVVLCLAVGCRTTASLEKLRERPLSKTEFHDILATLYKDFAEIELESYDWWSSQHFADKGLIAATQRRSAPENPADWDLSEHDEIELQSAYRSVTQKLTPAFIAAEPSRAATLQFAYDCWLEQQEEAWDTQAIDRCKNQFYALLDETDTPTQIGGPLSTSYLMHFDWGASEINGMARDELLLIASHLQRKENYAIVINGHADRSGSDEYNLALSQSRAEFIRNVLVKYGIPKHRINYFAFGESDPKILTDDGVRLPANRRVEIFIE